MSGKSLAACAERIDVLLSKVETLPDAALQEDLREIIQCLLEYHGAALARLLSLASKDGGKSSSLVSRLADDELVSSLLSLHGLHPVDLQSRVLEALRSVRPFLESHGGDVELVGLGDGVVRLRLQGSCHGCPSSAATLKSRIEQAIFEAAPEIEGVEVEEDAAAAAPPRGFVAMERLSIE